MDTKQHWEKVYFDKSANAVSWFQPHAIRSLKLIQRLVVDKAAHIIDVGGGASTLVDDLLEQGYSNLSVLDLSAAALQVAKSGILKPATSAVSSVSCIRRTPTDQLMSALDWV